MQNVFIFGIILFFAVLAIYAFKEGNRTRHGLKFRNKPDFKRMKIDEKKINDHSKI